MRGTEVAAPARPLARRLDQGGLDWPSLRMGLRDDALGDVVGASLLLTGLDAAQREAVLALAVAGVSRTGARDAVLLGGSVERLREFGAECIERTLLVDVGVAVGRVLEQGAPAPLILRGRVLDFAERTQVMGVLNVTPDSFSDGGAHATTAQAVAHALRLIDEGADLLDIGGESTRPGAAPVGLDEELGRVIPVIEALRAQSAIPISIDTTKAEVARAALAAGADLVNDVSGFTFDPAIAGVTAAAGAAACVQHIQGAPQTMQADPRYRDVVAEVMWGLEEALVRALAAGLPRERVLVDPGIGFGKTGAHNLMLLRRLGDLRQLGAPILIGTSRKAFLGQLAGGLAPDQRRAPSLGSIAAAVMTGGVDMVRVHDVEASRRALAVADAVARASGGGSAFTPPSSVG